MGNRQQHRHTLALHMEVFRGSDLSQPIFKCRTRNISPDGAMILNKGFQLRKGSKLKLLLKATCKSVRKQFEIPAKVVWKTPTSLGIQFFPGKGAETREFKKFLFEAKVSSHARARERWERQQVPITVASEA